MASVQPLIIDYSFAANRTQATDMVDLDQLDAVLNQIATKLNETIAALNVTTRDDDTLRDSTIELRNLADDALEHLTTTVNAAIPTA
jgi:hypothetical protein